MLKEAKQEMTVEQRRNFALKVLEEAERDEMGGSG